MNRLYLDLVGGISGDMFLGALIDLGVSASVLTEQLQRLGLQDWHLHADKTAVNAITGTHLDVHCHDHGDHEHVHEEEHDHEHHHEHVHRGFTEIRKMIESSTLSDWVKQHAVSMFQRVGTAEAKIHGKTLEDIHFHEVGAVDSIVDMVGACIGLELLGKPQVQASLLVDGCGQTHCAHGIIPIPVPATLAILGARGVPLSQCEETSEMITPTGAAILAEFVETFGPMQGIVAEKIGISFGSRTLQTRPNMLRAVLGTGAKPVVAATSKDWETDTVELLQTNLDDTTPEVLGYVLEKAFAMGALDVWHTPIVMKKGRPAVELSLLCEPNQVGLFVELLLTETGSIGVRHYPVSRFKLTRSIQTISTVFGEIQMKVTCCGKRIFHAKPEWEVCSRIAREKGVPLQHILEEAVNKYRTEK